MTRVDQKERRQYILNQLREHGRVENIVMSEELKVTEMTIRRDIDKLENEGLAVRVYGGAVLSATRTFDPPFDVRVTHNVDAKMKIARKAVELLPTGANVALDFGTKMLFVAKLMRKHAGATVSPASIRCANELSANHAIRQILPGGQLKHGEMSVYGSIAEDFYRSHHWDIALISAAGVDSDKGLSDFGEPEARLKEAMIANTDRVVALAEASQIGLVTFSPICPVNQVHTIITDLDQDDPAGIDLIRRGIEVIYV